MKKIMLTTAFIVAMVVGGTLPVYAANSPAGGSGGATTPTATPGVGGSAVGHASSGVSAIGGDSNSASLESIIKLIVNTLLFLIGALSVVVLVYAGIMFVGSNGNPESIKKAKNIILYAVVGLVVAIVSFAIVNFVIDTFVGKQQAAPTQNSTPPAGNTPPSQTQGQPANPNPVNQPAPAGGQAQSGGAKPKTP